MSRQLNGERLILCWGAVLSSAIMLVNYWTKFYQFYLIWNLFLAYVPLWCGYRLRQAEQPLWRKLLYGVWFIFYPNALYMLTDLIHLQNDSFYVFFTNNSEATYQLNLIIWVRLILLVLAVALGVLMGCQSYHLVRQEWQKHYRNSWWVSGLILLLISVMNGIALVMGRFVRLNSWDIMRDALGVAQHAINALAPPYIGFTLLFAGVHCVIVAAYLQWRRWHQA